MKIGYKPVVSNVEIDEGEIKRVVKDRFTRNFGDDFVKDIIVERYPENYEVVVFVKNKDRVEEIFDLCHELSDDFYAQGLPLAFSTRVDS